MPKRSLHGKSKDRKSLSVKSFAAKNSNRSQVCTKKKASTNPYRKIPDGAIEGAFRDRAKIKLLNMYRQKADTEKMKIAPSQPARIEPDRKWFGNTRVTNQKELESLRNELEEQQQKKDPYTIVINQRKLPMQLLSDSTLNPAPPQILAVEPFDEIIGPKMRRKRPKLESYDLEGMTNIIEEKRKKYNQEEDRDWNKQEREAEDRKKLNKDRMLEAGQSKRIWDELYKGSILNINYTILFILLFCLLYILFICI